MKEKFKEFLTDNMLLKEPVATIITNHVNHYYLTEIEGLKKENERVVELLKQVHEAGVGTMLIYLDYDFNLRQQEIDKSWLDFAKANNIKL